MDRLLRLKAPPVWLEEAGVTPRHPFYVGSGGAISLESNHEKTQGKAANERSRIERQDNNRSWQT